MILIKLKNDAEIWTEKYDRESIDGKTWLKFDTRSKGGKVFHREVSFDQIAEIADVGEVNYKKPENTSDILDA